MKSYSRIATDLTTPVALAAGAYVFLFSLIDLFLTGGLVQGLDGSGVALLFLFLPMLSAVFATILMWVAVVVLHPILRLLQFQNSDYGIAFVAAGVGMIPAWWIVSIVMALENGFGFTRAHVWAALIIAITFGSVAHAVHHKLYFGAMASQQPRNAK